MSQMASGSNTNEATGLTQVDHIILAGMWEMLANLNQNGGLTSSPSPALTTICNINEVNRLKEVDPEGAKKVLTETVENFARTLKSYIGCDEEEKTFPNI